MTTQTLNEKIARLTQAAESGHLIGVLYHKDGADAPAPYTLRLGADVAAAFERHGAPVTGAGSWQSGLEKSGKNSWYFERDGVEYFWAQKILPNGEPESKKPRVWRFDRLTLK
jgi:hypothetical protein